MGKIALLLRSGQERFGIVSMIAQVTKVYNFLLLTTVLTYIHYFYGMISLIHHIDTEAKK